jgi:ABC transporter substrate binding protein (PQQ-dependent alcohol dehydrogenase system)
MTEGRRARGAAVLAAALAWALVAAGPAPGQETKPFTIGYLEVAGDARYAERRAYTGLRLRTAKRPVDGALVALRDSRFAASALGLELAIERRSGESAAALAEIARRLRDEAGVRFFLIDAAGEDLRALAADTAADDIVLFNLSDPADGLRGAACAPHLFHTIPSRAMLMDGLAQYLVEKGWREVLVLRGPLPEDAEQAAAFARSARKFGARIVATKDFVLGNDPRHRERNNIALLTASPAHEVVFLADGDGEFGRYVPFQTNRPRPVVGSEGLVASPWHWTWERHGAPQLNQRFEKRAGRTMEGADWAAWAALKAIVEALARTGSTDHGALRAYLTSERLTLDAYKGVAASFRPWNNQLRQPVLLHTHNAVIARAPRPGFLHPKDYLDTLGADRPESACGR